MGKPPAAGPLLDVSVLHRLAITEAGVTWFTVCLSCYSVTCVALADLLLKPCVYLSLLLVLGLVYLFLVRNLEF